MQTARHSAMKRRWTRNGQFHLFLLPAVILTLVFSYGPMSGIIIAFQRFLPAKGLFGRQEWVGLGNFEYIFSVPLMGRALFNTVFISAFEIVLGIVVPLAVSLMLNEVRRTAYKRTVQTVIYLPYFFSWVLLSGILIDILSPNGGIVNNALGALGIKPIFFLGDNRWFRPAVIVTNVWKEFGFSTVIYLAAITNIDVALYEVARIDGAGRFAMMRYITIPGISHIVALMLVLSLGNVLNANFDQIFNMYSPQVYETGDILDTLVYRMGLMDAQYGPASAVGLFKSLVTCLLTVVSYAWAYRYASYTLF